MKTGIKYSLRVLSFTFLAVLIFLAIIFISVFIQTKISPDKAPSIFGYKPFVVLSNSMEPEIYKGDLVIIKEIDKSSLQKNDIIAFRDSENHVVTHRITETVKNSNEEKLITKGDNNNAIDSENVSLENVEGKYLFKLAGLGNLVLEIQKPITLIITLIVIVCLGAVWVMSGDNKLSKEERIELERLRKEKRRKKEESP